MSETLDDKFFDFTFKILNYAIEFAESPGYASLRMTDVLERMVELSSEIEGISRADFYRRVGEKFKSRRLMSEQKSRDTLAREILDDLLSMFIEEWRATGN